MSTLKISDGRCQFCHRTAGNVKRLIAGDSAFICEDCVSTAVSLLHPTAAPAGEAQRPDRYVFQRLVRHFAPLHPQELVATSRAYPLRQQGDLQRALDNLFGERNIPSTFVGIHQPYRHETLGLSKLLEQSQNNAVEVAPAQYEDVAIGAGQTVACLKNGLWLRNDERGAYALVLAQREDYGRGADMTLEVVAPPGDVGAEVRTWVFEALERQLSKDSCYRGRVISLEPQYPYAGYAPRITVHELEPVDRDQLILPDSTLRALERNVLRFAEQREALRSMGLSTQKGLLFHGPPGTGKTHCIRYLAGQLKGHTTFLITAEGVGALPEYMALARLLQPALVVIEDADLIARERTERDNACDEVMLNRLLNEMDGLRERADVFFVLTTNRPGNLEPALANRPGRIDQAIEFPLPDEALRVRLIDLYSGSLAIPEALRGELAKRTDGASPAFIRELLRRIAQLHVDANDDGEVNRQVAEEALHEMLFSGGALNARVLGGAAVPPTAGELTSASV